MLECFGVKDRLQQILRMLRDFNFLSLFSPSPPSFSLFPSTPIFSRFLFLSEALFFFFLYKRTPAKRKTVYNGADEWSKPFFGSSFLSLFLFFFSIYFCLSLWKILVGLLGLRSFHNVRIHLELNLACERNSTKYMNSTNLIISAL